MKEIKKQENKKTNEKELDFKLVYAGTTTFGTPSFMRNNQTKK